MRAISPLLLKAATLLSSTSFLPAVLAAQSPAIDVSLQASFPKAPFLLELLETAAQENPACYYPLLDRIAAGTFEKDTTDEQLYTHFQKLLQEEKFITELPALSSFQFALSIHSSAPRIEAQYQYYQTSVEPFHYRPTDAECFVSIVEEGRETCFNYSVRDGVVSKQETANVKIPSNRKLDFDHTEELSSQLPASTFYTDITSPHWGPVYQAWREETAGKRANRFRYKPHVGAVGTPLVVNGYGIELALKKTDYIVIDDRETEGKDKSAEAKSDDAADVKPLSSSELRDLGIKASTYILSSKNPFETLLDVSKDFPKHSANLALQNVSSDVFLDEYWNNRELQVEAGANALWLNGVQVDALNVNAFSLLELLRRERKLINGLSELGFTAPEAISILQHEAIADAQADSDVQRYDYRDEREGGNVILWMNDIEKDKRYEDWPTELQALLQRVYPGQLPAVRRDIHNLIMPTDFTNPDHVATVVDQLRTFVMRKIPMRVGLVPVGHDKAGIDQAKVVYHLNEVYGLTAVMDYLQSSMAGKALQSPSKKTFDATIKDRKVRKTRQVQELSSVLDSELLKVQVESAQKWLVRLAANSATPPIFINGAAVGRDDSWLQALSSRVSLDLRTIQQRVFEETIAEETWLPSLFLLGASARRNPFVIPEDEKSINVIDVAKLHREHEKFLINLAPLKLSLAEDPAQDPAETIYGSASLLVIADLNSDAGRLLLSNALVHTNDYRESEVTILHSSETASITKSSYDALIHTLAEVEWPDAKVQPFIKSHLEESLLGTWHQTHWKDGVSPLLAALDLHSGEQAIMLNGRLIGPIPDSRILSPEDFGTLLAYERKKRMLPVDAALEALELSAKVKTPLDAAKLSSLVALSTISDVPEGIFDTTPGPRLSFFDKWATEHTSFSTGDKNTASLQIIASIDPASEKAQRWIPILKVISELNGVFTRIFLQPVERLQELPVKRFYRHVLESRPSFDAAGGLKDLHARFNGIPSETLLTMTMDVPPSWLVAPKESVHDLDNIKLSNLKTGESIEALYELEHILIEGHSRDITTGPPPRGVQLLLGTERDPDYAGTIIMANIGYFQFKANPGVYNLALQEGRSQEIFHIDSAGTQGYNARTGDNTTEITLTSFQGVTLFPRLSRNPGKEEEDVLEPATTAAAELLHKGTDIADSLLSKAGLSNIRTGTYVAKGVQLGQSILSAAGLAKDTTSRSAHADINIFSVASGHLYERMLNIMMVSVLRHTNKTVKFWFIEQFLSPSFKTSLPHLAAHYNFTYSMVTYKWPHWLRAQKEKQRVIWGYKILFLDVLFPLDLDKVIFVDADQIVRTNMWDLVTHDLEGAPYGFTPMCDSRTEMEGFRFWKQGYWKNFLRGRPYHISALYVVDLVKFRQMAAGDRLRQQYHQLSRDPESLSNLDQDLPNHMQMTGLEIHSLPQEWLWCETWCSDESLKVARTIDLCNNPQTKEPKLDRARRQVPEWTVYDEEIAGVLKGAQGAGQERVEPPHRSAEGESSAHKENRKDEL